MKAVLILICTVVAGILAHGTHGSLKDEEADLEKIHDECQADPKSHVDESLFDDIKNHLDDPQVRAHFRCEATKAGLQAENGKLIISAIKKKVALSVCDENKVCELVKECAVDFEDDPEKSAIHLWMCFYDNDVAYFHEF